MRYVTVNEIRTPVLRPTTEWYEQMMAGMDIDHRSLGEPTPFVDIQESDVPSQSQAASTDLMIIS